MIFLKLLIGIICFVIGLIYLYKPSVILSINSFARDTLFNDRRIILERKKLAILFFCLSFITIYMGFSSFSCWIASSPKSGWQAATRKYHLYLAMQDHCAGRNKKSEERYLSVLEGDPNNVTALRQLATTYTAQGKKKQARAMLHRLLRLYPERKALLAELESLKD